VPSSWDGQQLLLNFGAVDYEATVFVNGQQAGFNRGGYYKFAIDVTNFARYGQANELYGLLSTQ
jgi:beta-galactosidase/beta-glucuronidase